jgi:hypothetical protein
MLPRSRQLIATVAVSGPARGRSRRTCGDRVLQFREVDVDDAGGRHGLLCGHAILQRLPEHGRRLDAVDHPVHDAVVRLRHVDVRHGDLTTGLGVCALLPPAGLDRAARLAPRSPFCEPRRAGTSGIRAPFGVVYDRASGALLTS